jgi:mono/diheme cytochrome c family protein
MRPPFASALPGFAAFALALIAPSLAEAAPRAARRTAKPAPSGPAALLDRYCQACHGPTKQKGGLRIDRLNPDFVGGDDGEHWQSILDVLHKSEMPPEDKPQLSDEERRSVIGWLEAGLAEAARAKEAQASSVLRRLTREQYTNTLRDLLGVDSDYNRLLPPESPSKMGMQNDGRILASSTLHLEQTMRIARVAVDRALSLGAPPPAWRFRYVFGPQKVQAAKKVDLGYQAQPLDPDTFRVETFEDRGPVRTPTLSPKGDLRDRCYVDLRGSTDYDHKKSPRRYSVDEKGVLMLPAKPHVEREAQIWQGPNPNLALVLRDFPAEGPFVLRVEVSRASAEGDAPWLRAYLGNRLDDGMEYATFDRPRRVDAPPGKPQVIEFRGRLENLPAPVVDPEDKEFLSNLMVVGVWNDVLVSRPEETTPALVIKSMEFEGPITEAWPSATHRRIFFDDRRKAEPESYAREILTRFLGRAFRRPASAAQVDRYLTFWRRQAHGGASFEEAVRDTLAAVLASPAFLHHVESVRGAGAAGPGAEPGGRFVAGVVAGGGPGTPGTSARPPLDDFALASRLSYLLWNTMPDDELLAVASAGELRARLRAQATRLLADPRARDFFQGYAAQWLDLGALDRVRVDVKQYPRFTRFVKEDMRLETSRYLEHLFQQNRPIDELVDADYSLLNQNLAEFYGVSGVRGPEFRPVPLPPGGRRGGLLAQGSFLVGRSTGEDSHPIKRGVWLAKKLLDDPPPPPPPNVPEIDRENPEIARLSVKAQLELHRNRESCRDCHRKLDPWGIPFEAFDAAGLPRTSITKTVHDQPFSSPVDTATELVDGTKIDGVVALQKYLLTVRRDQLRRSAARHLAAYALGRTPGFIDEKVVQEICARTRARGDGLRELLFAVIESDAFQSK